MEELRSEIQKALETKSIIQSRKEILESFDYKLGRGWTLSEKQIAFARILIDETKKDDDRGVWQITPEIEKDIKTLLLLSQRYSTYYLAEHASKLGRSLNSLRYWQCVIKDSKLDNDPNELRPHYEYVSKKMEKVLDSFKNPRLTIGDLVTIKFETVNYGLIIDGPFHGPYGSLEYLVDVNGRHSKYNVNSLLRTIRKRKEKNELDTSHNEPLAV